MFGVPDELLEQIARDAQPKDFEVWEDNWPAVEMFVRIQTQWRIVGGMGAAYVGLDYQALAWVFDIYNVEDRRQLFEDLQVMEAAALPILNQGDD